MWGQLVVLLVVVLILVLVLILYCFVLFLSDALTLDRCLWLWR